MGMIDKVFYGELAIVGFNERIEISKNCSRRQSKIALYKRPIANAVRPGPVKRVADARDSGAVRSQAKHSVSYTLSRHETVVVEYVPDLTMDMFQIGRSTNSHIDFVVSEPRPLRSGPGLASRDEHRGHTPGSGYVSPLAGQAGQRSPHRTSAVTNPDTRADSTGCARNTIPEESAVSRFACRIYIERDPPHTARIYAAGFNASNNIFLGELAVKWNNAGQMDGLTTNGVMILRADPEQVLSSNTDNSDAPSAPLGKEAEGSSGLSEWREVSICGSVYQMRNKRCVPTKENLVNEDNVLRDKTLIDLCGVTLFWRSGSGLQKSVNSHDLEVMIDGLNQARFQCPILYKTLRLPSLTDPQQQHQQRAHLLESHSKRVCGGASAGLTTHTGVGSGDPTATDSKPYVYLNCGHVHGWHTWRAGGDVDSVRTCPLCLQPSRFVPLQMGLESAFYVDRALATHCFNPCGHMASEKTVRYWCSIRLPNNHDFELHARCPFCLATITPKPVRLRFNSDMDEDTLLALLNAQLSYTDVADPEGQPDAKLPSAPPVTPPTQRTQSAAPVAFGP